VGHHLHQIIKIAIMSPVHHDHQLAFPIICSISYDLTDDPSLTTGRIQMIAEIYRVAGTAGMVSLTTHRDRRRPDRRKIGIYHEYVLWIDANRLCSFHHRYFLLEIGNARENLRFVFNQTRNVLQ
jgi:hypothetical protein